MSPRNPWQGWLLILPALVLLVAFTHYPAVATLWHSFFSNSTTTRPSVFVGIDNYRTMVEDPVFWASLYNNFWFALVTVPVSIALAIVMALFVNARLPGKGFVRLAYFTPTVLPMIAVANIWLFFYTPQYGLIAQVLSPFGIASPNWLGDKTYALGAMIVVAIWKEAGFFMIFYLAALQQVSPSLREAAVLEGASRWQYFWRVLFPLLMPTTIFVLVNALINANEPRRTCPQGASDARDHRRLAPRPAVDPAARLCGMDGVPPGRQRDALRHHGTAHAAELPCRMGSRAVCALLSEHHAARDDGARVPTGTWHLGSLRICALRLQGQGLRVPARVDAVDGDAGRAHRRELQHDERARHQ
jgi:sn-glycerol 3-phosphate transport system permease protein